MIRLISLGMAFLADTEDTSDNLLTERDCLHQPRYIWWTSIIFSAEDTRLSIAIQWLRILYCYSYRLLPRMHKGMAGVAPHHSFKIWHLNSSGKSAKTQPKEFHHLDYMGEHVEARSFDSPITEMWEVNDGLWPWSTEMTQSTLSCLLAIYVNCPFT